MNFRLRNRLGLKVELQSSTDLAKTLVEIWTRGPRCTGAFRIGRLTVMWLTQPPLWLVGAYWDVREYVEEQLPTWRRRLSSNKIVRLLLGLRYTVAVYEVRRSYGGPEEGGWYYDSGDLIRTVKRFRSEADAWECCNRLNEELQQLRTDWVYDNQRAKVYSSTAPDSFPAHRPYYC